MSYWPAAEWRNSFLIRNSVNEFRMHLRHLSSAAPNAPLAALVLLVVSLSFGCSTATSDTQTVASPETSSESSDARIGAVVRNNADLATALDHLLEGSEYKTARWGIAVVSLPDGKLLYGHNHAQLFTPASNMKIYTTAVALDLLGADYRWRTSVYADQQPDETGRIKGDVILYGRGAPDLVSDNRKENVNSLEELAADLAQRGVKQVTGNVVGDESYFRGEPVGDGWQQNDLQWYFGAEASALSVNNNSADISITPSQKLGDPATVTLNADAAEYLHVNNQTAMVDSSREFRLGVQRGLSDNEVLVWGEVPIGARGYGASLSVHRPSLWAARLFLRSLQAHGISVAGSAITHNWRVPQNQRFDPTHGQELAFVMSKPLSEIASLTNKQSINLYAELILRTLGRERGERLGGNKPNGRELGDEEAGAELILMWLGRAGVKSERLAIHDGSGLSRLNLITPESAAGLLAAIGRTSVASVFRNSLPIAGTDGTLQGRLSTLAGRVFAKTGAIIYDHALSGYLITAEGKTVAFSIISNDFVEKSGASPLVDRLVTVIATTSTRPPQASKPSPSK